MKLFSRIPVPHRIRVAFKLVSPHLGWLPRWLRRLFYFGPPIALAIMLFPVSIMRVQGESMSPLLNVNSSPDEAASPADWVVVRKVHIPEFPSWLFRQAPQKKTQVERGQVVVYYAPHNP